MAARDLRQPPDLPAELTPAELPAADPSAAAGDDEGDGGGPLELFGVEIDGGETRARGVRMPWPDVLASASALAAALGIRVEES